MLLTPTSFIGIDVQTNRECAYAAIDEFGETVASGWLPRHAISAASTLQSQIVTLTSDSGERTVIGIDAPRCFLTGPRAWYWGKSGWRRFTPADRGFGRHCEVVIAALNLARPQWTPIEKNASLWMQLGVELFEQLQPAHRVYEVFPSASYKQLAGDPSVRIGINLSTFAPGPKDMLDAYVAAVTVREFVLGAGCSVGGGDGLGEIILPRRVEQNSAVFTWPMHNLAARSMEDL